MPVSLVGEFFGPMYWGFVGSTLLVGATLIQGYMYFSRCRDPIVIQLVITFMLLLDLASTVVMAITIDHYFVVDFGNYSTFGTIPPEWVLEPAFTAMVTCIAQLFFATRIHIIMRQFGVFGLWERVIPGTIVCTALFSLGAGIGKTVVIGTYPPIELGGNQMIIASSLEEGFAFVADLFTTCTLIYILASAREGLRRKQSPIRRLFFFTLNRGILVTILQIGTLIAFVSATSYMYWMPFHLCKSKLYTNTLLAMLNSRNPTEGFSTSRVPQTIRHTARSSGYHDDTRNESSHMSLQDISNGESGSVGINTPDQAQIQAWENARVNWNPPPSDPKDG